MKTTIRNFSSTAALAAIGLCIALISFSTSCNNRRPTETEDYAGAIYNDENEDIARSPYGSDDYHYVKQGWPTASEIERDLAGHSVSEGVEEGYHSSDWTFDIERGDVSDLKIVEELVNTPEKYIAIVDMKLAKGGNYYYQTRARVAYVKDEDGLSAIDYVTSMGMNVVATDEFINDITARIGDDGWGGVSCLKLHNNGEVPLVVGGSILNNNGWNKFGTRLDAHADKNVGGTFSGGSVTDYVISFVIRDIPR